MERSAARSEAKRRDAPQRHATHTSYRERSAGRRGPHSVEWVVHELNASAAHISY